MYFLPLRPKSLNFRLYAQIPKSYQKHDLCPREGKNWDHEDTFNIKPFGRLAVAFTTTKAFLGSNQENPYHFR